MLYARGRCAMTRQCCTAGRISVSAGSILPAAVLVLLPKCPLCLAAWLTVATGVSFSATGAAWVRVSIVLLLLPSWQPLLGVARSARQRSMQPLTDPSIA